MSSSHFSLRVGLFLFKGGSVVANTREDQEEEEEEKGGQMPVPGKAPFLERTTMPRSREM